MPWFREAAGDDGDYLWALIGDDGEHHQVEYEAGIRTKVVRLSWRSYIPAEGEVNAAYVERMRAQLDRLRGSGFGIILEAGFHDTPEWVHANYHDTRYVNQFGVAYSDDGEIDSGDANLVFNPVLRALVADYLRQVFIDLGTNFIAVRLGGGRWGELTYPPANYRPHGNAYWAFDANASARSPVPSWRPGQPSPNDEARRFLTWYLDALTEYQTWQIVTLRRFYAGPIMMLYPSWGIRPGQIEAAVAQDLRGSTGAEVNGEIQRGFDFARQIGAITDPNVIVTTTWLDADADGDRSNDPRRWSPVKYLAALARAHPLDLKLFGENTGQGSTAALEHSVAQVRRHGLIGMAWYREDELLSGAHATLADYRRLISAMRAPAVSSVD